jgi:hypothetical protein
VSNSLGNFLQFYNASASLIDTNAIDGGPLTLGASTLTVSNDLAFPDTNVLNFVLGTNAAQVAVAGDLTLGGTVNVTNGPGFGVGTYTLLTYTGSLGGGLPGLGSTPPGFNYSFDTSHAGQVRLTVISTTPAPAVPTNLTATATNLGVNLTWGQSANATSYNLKRSTTNGGSYALLANVAATNYSDTLVTNGVTYFYVVSATNSAGESANSTQAGAMPLPSVAPVNLTAQTGGSQMQISWPHDHLGWHLEIQTNHTASGISTNWTTWSGSFTTNQVFIPVVPTNGSVFLRLAYP